MGNKLTKKVGPLPVWAWALVVIGGVLAAKYLRGQKSAAGASSDVSAGADTYSGSGEFGSGGGGGGGGYMVTQPLVTSAPAAVEGGYPDTGHSDDYSMLLGTAIDALTGKEDNAVAVLGGSLDNAVGGLTDTNASLIDLLAHPPKQAPVSVTVKAPLDKGGKRTLAPHHKVAVVKPLPIKPAAPKPSPKVIAAAKPAPKPAVRTVVHTPPKAKTSPAVGGGGHNTMV
jgi:hypothetical protein